jgi:hypothetical protein
VAEKNLLADTHQAVEAHSSTGHFGLPSVDVEQGDQIGRFFAYILVNCQSVEFFKITSVGSFFHGKIFILIKKWFGINFGQFFFRKLVWSP